MKKIILISAIACASQVACAQSSVSLFGVVDLAMSRLQADGLGHKVGMSSGSNTAGRLGFKGTEDLGGGYSAMFWLEGALASDEGNAAGFNFQRQSTLSLIGPFGEVRMGRDFSTTFRNVTGFDPFAIRGVGSAMSNANFGYSDVRNSNQIQYFTPNSLGGFYGNLAYSWGGNGGAEPQSNVPNNKLGNAAGYRVGYLSGPLHLSTAYMKWKQVIGAASNTPPVVIGKDLTSANLAGSYDFGVVKLSAFHGREKVDGNPVGNNTLNSTVLGLFAPIGAGEIRASYGHYDLKDSANDTDKIAFGYGYNFSKRTQAYVNVAFLRNKGAATRVIKDSDGLALTGTMRPGGKSNGFDIGLRHWF